MSHEEENLELELLEVKISQCRLIKWACVVVIIACGFSIIEVSLRFVRFLQGGMAG